MRHAHARSNVTDRVSSAPPGEGLSEQGVEEALALRETLAYAGVGLGVATRLARTQETLELALGGLDVERIVLSALDEIGFGAYEGGPLGEYRSWAWANEPDAACLDAALAALLSRPEDVVVAVSHSLPIRYVLDASDGRFPAARIEHVPHATPFALSADAVERAAETLRVWATAPRFVDA